MKYAEEKWLASLNRRSTGSRKDFTSPKQCLKLSRHPQSIHFRPSFGTGDDMLPTYGLTPDELSCLAASGTLGWLSTDHVTWVLSQLNAMQQDTMLLPPNTIVNITNKMARKRKIFNFGTVKRLALPLNVGKEKARLSSVASTIQAIIGSLLYVVELRPFKRILYCDTLSWKPPSILLMRSTDTSATFLVLKCVMIRISSLITTPWLHRG